MTPLNLGLLVALAMLNVACLAAVIYLGRGLRRLDEELACEELATRSLQVKLDELRRPFGPHAA
jgi:hypothetical protein